MIRTALFATAALAVALPALAQEAAPQPPAAPAPAAAAPAQPAAPADPAAAAQAPAAAAPAQAAAEPKAEIPPVLPTTGDGAVITSLLTNVCKPLANGGDFQKLVKAQKLKEDRKSGEWVMPLSAKPYQVSIVPTGTANKGLCDLRVRYAVGQDQPIIDALNVWRFLQEPQLHGKRNEQANYADVQRITTTWDNWENQMLDGKMIGLVLTQINKLDGTPNVNPDYDEAMIKYQIRAPQQLEGVATKAAAAPATAQPAG